MHIYIYMYVYVYRVNPDPCGFQCFMARAALLLTMRSAPRGGGYVCICCSLSRCVYIYSYVCVCISGLPSPPTSMQCSVNPVMQCSTARRALAHDAQRSWRTRGERYRCISFFLDVCPCVSLYLYLSIRTSGHP